MVDLKAIRARSSSATPGPWKRMPHPFGDSEMQGCVMASDEANNILVAGACVICRSEDCEFVAHARTDVPSLCDALEAAQALNQEAVKMLREVEWRGGNVGDMSGCPSCGADAYPYQKPEKVHFPDCKVAALLSRLEGKP